MIDGGADVTAKDNEDHMPLYYLLFKANAVDSEKRNIIGITLIEAQRAARPFFPWHKADWKTVTADEIRDILAKGADVNAINHAGCPPLRYAISSMGWARKNARKHPGSQKNKIALRQAQESIKALKNSGAKPLSTFPKCGARK